MKLSCKDLTPNTTCTFEAVGSSVPEVASKMMAHAKTDHPKDIAGMTDEAVMDMMELKVHE